MNELPLTKSDLINFFLPKVNAETRQKFNKLSGGKRALVIAQTILSGEKERTLDQLIDQYHITKPPIDAEEVEHVAEMAISGEEAESEEEVETEDELGTVVKKYKNRGFKFSKGKFGPIVLVDKAIVKPAKSKGGGGDGFFRIASTAISSLGHKKGSGKIKKMKSKLSTFSSGGKTFNLSDKNLSTKIRKAFPGPQNVGKRESAATKANILRYRALAKTIKRPIALHTYTRRPNPVFKNRVILISPKGVKGSPIHVVAASYPTTKKGVGGRRSLSANRSMSPSVKRFVKTIPGAKLVRPNALRKIGPKRTAARPWALPKGRLKGRRGARQRKVLRAKRKGTGAVKFEKTHDIFTTRKQKFSDSIGPEVLIFDAGFLMPGQRDGFFQIVDDLEIDPEELIEILEHVEITAPKGEPHLDVYEVIQELNLSSDHLDQDLIEAFPGVENRPKRMIASLIVNFVRYKALSEILEHPINLTVIERGEEEEGHRLTEQSPIPIPWQDTPHEDGINIAIPTYPITA